MVELQLDSLDEILSAMVVYAFLSYRDGYIRIPNYELMEKFQCVLIRESMGNVAGFVCSSKKIVQATIDGLSAEVAQYL